MWSWLAHVLGMDNLSGPYYGFWSGAGSDISELAMVGALLGLLRKGNCEVHGCWRLGRHTVQATGHRVCRHHHPEGAPTARHITQRHAEHVRRQGR